MIDDELHTHLHRSYWLVASLAELAEGFVIDQHAEVPQEHVDAFHDAQRYLLDTTTLLVKHGRLPA